jgi:antibiotic biosynthesis monooxygenase (ABM) superfamily enzyme
MQIWMGVFLIWLGIMSAILWRVVTPSVRQLQLPIWILIGNIIHWLLCGDFSSALPVSFPRRRVHCL